MFALARAQRLSNESSRKLVPEIDLMEERLRRAYGQAVEKVNAFTGGSGVDTAIEALDIPATFMLCEDLVGPGGIIANIGFEAHEVFGRVADSGALKVIIATSER